MTKEKELFWQLQFNRALTGLRNCTPDFKSHFRALLIRAMQVKIATTNRRF